MRVFRVTVVVPSAFLQLIQPTTARALLTSSARCSGAKNFLIRGWITGKPGAKKMVTHDQYHVGLLFCFVVFFNFLNFF